MYTSHSDGVSDSYISVPGSERNLQFSRPTGRIQLKCFAVSTKISFFHVVSFSFISHLPNIFYIHKALLERTTSCLISGG